MRLLLGRAVDDDALRADAVVGADERAEGRRGMAEAEGDLRLLGHGEPEPAILLRDREAEEAEPAHLGDDLGRDAVLLGDALLERPQALGHEALDGVEELGERVAVERHPKDLSACAARGSWRSPPSGPRQRGGRAQQAAIFAVYGFGRRPQAAFCRSRRSGTFRSARLASSLALLWWI